MKFALDVLNIHCPSALRKKVLRDIFSSTARAFGAEPPDMKDLSAARLLETYARFTQRAGEDVLAHHPEPETVRSRLFHSASELGTSLRRRFRLRSGEDVMKLSRIMYKILGISFEGRSDGEVIIRSCYFSRFYSADICRLISALDEGAAAGLSGGGRLEFSQRLTDGHDSCRARFFLGEGE